MAEIAKRQGRLGWCGARYTKALVLSCWIAVLGVGEGQATTQPTFDLVCDTQRTQQIRFRFDLQKKKWCMGECQSAWLIDDLGESMIKLSLRTKDDSDYWSIDINRYTSEFWIVRRGYGSKPQDWGQCKVEPFSGFPQKRF